MTSDDECGCRLRERCRKAINKKEPAIAQNYLTFYDDSPFRSSLNGEEQTYGMRIEGLSEMELSLFYLGLTRCQKLSNPIFSN